MVGIYETNLLSLVSLRLNNNYHRQTKMVQCREIFRFENLGQSQCMFYESVVHIK